ncbi:hypothetical protein L6164_010706 [Bauhinia variegata]|uniref:Uncharacterized protein n=1 Tax=Bauhinia variegata TaxID=167791 RepID=A0ACB9P351_BAUVA|nr:hypothetical protein L6164_010706 [Bauhinia variegata]
MSRWKILLSKCRTYPNLIFSSRVNDGICDCCDGSDEYDGKVKCPNTCWEAGKVARDKLKRKIATYQEGVTLRKQEVEQTKLASAKDEAELLKLKEEESILKGIVKQLKERKEQIEKAEEKEEKDKKEAEKKGNSGTFKADEEDKGLGSSLMVKIMLWQPLPIMAIPSKLTHQPNIVTLYLLDKPQQPPEHGRLKDNLGGKWDKRMCFCCNEKLAPGHPCKANTFSQLELAVGNDPVDASEEGNMEDAKQGNDSQKEAEISFHTILWKTSAGTMKVQGTFKGRKVFIAAPLVEELSLGMEAVSIFVVQIGNGEAI